ncbi:uncharacterized protein LOC8043229 isoform X1 [Ixodes scapularis]|uniref:uncharacterized protein LOC8043229 isoform X1 n=1 Tax=Ixodes scapularis TaxID=6945 RepID=UPI0011617669|nr:uncharacterized protein LOC8043229 isoform X1 [Ixodes scapularis]
MSHYLGLSAVLLVCLAVTAYSQTFQYSRGWTNGKRRVAEMPLVGVPLRASNDHRALDEVLSKFTPRDRIVLERLGHMVRVLDHAEEEQQECREKGSC